MKCWYGMLMLMGCSVITGPDVNLLFRRLSELDDIVGDTVLVVEGGFGDIVVEGVTLTGCGVERDARASLDAGTLSLRITAHDVEVIGCFVGIIEFIHYQVILYDLEPDVYSLSVIHEGSGALEDEELFRGDVRVR